jgi:uracil-DNA glycosylase family 4
MFTGDSSGDWLFEALFRYGFASRPESLNADDGLLLRDCLITAVARCAPPQNRLLADEIAHCREYLEMELKLAKEKKIVLVLGRVAFQVFKKIWQDCGNLPEGSDLNFRHGGEWTLADGLRLLSSYHPSRQNTQTGRLTREMFHTVFGCARAILDAVA